MKQLVLGKISSQNLADWFGIKYKSYANGKKKYLEILKDFCDFDVCYGGIEVKEIYLDTYVKNMRQIDNENYKKEIERCIKEQDGLSTIAGMTRKFRANKIADYAKYSERQVNRKLAKSGELLFGVAPTRKKAGGRGTIGVRDYIWAIKLDNYNNYRLMTKEEEELFNKFTKEVYSNLDPKEIQEAVLLQEEFLTTDMTKEEYIQISKERGYNFFDRVIDKFRSETGYMIVRASKHMFSAF